MATLFISDLHLSPERPDKLALFYKLLVGPALEAEALYILGDLFEAWIGDDDTTSPHREIVEALARYAATGKPLYLMHGNRDFLMGHAFEARSGGRLLPDPSLIDLYGEKTLLMHGDTLCTQDTDYQAFRKQVRDPRWITGFLQKPLAERAAIASNLREGSRAATRQKEAEIMDVEPAAVSQTMIDHGVRQLIHGHTHRPAIHRFEIQGQSARRIVLGDWYGDDYVLLYSAKEPQLVTAAALTNP
ncbi:MAG: UDP-2,3-diacylglucosamine diphosphatase [Gammaproteobacteria bacterium]